MTRSAIFDVDGTLTDTNRVDADCYIAAVESVFGIEDASGDWNDYADVTDSGILSDLVQNCLGREPSSSERKEFVSEFLSLLNIAHASDVSLFHPIPGADLFLKRLRELGWQLAVATGGFEQTARAKLAHAGIDVSDLPFATANDARTRVEILEIAIERLHGKTSTIKDKPVVFGDAIWDVEAATKMDLPIIGVGTGARAKELLNAGADAVVEDFQDMSAIVNTCNQLLK